LSYELPPGGRALAGDVVRMYDDRARPVGRDARQRRDIRQIVFRRTAISIPVSRPNTPRPRNSWRAPCYSSPRP